MKKKYYLYIILVLLIAFIAYNYYSAAKSEDNIDKFIREQVDAPRSSISIQYSSIDISPFQGNITFKDVNIIQPQTINRAKRLKIDLSYFDFLKFSIGGTEYGIKHLSDALLILNDASYINRKNRVEVHSQKINVDYSGDLWNAFLASFTPQSLNHNHKVVVEGSDVSYFKPNSSIGSFKADSLFINHTFSTAKQKLNTFQLQNVIWNPPQDFKQKYAFFIQGFGFKPDSILIDRSGFSYLGDGGKVQISDGIIENRLLTANFYGSVQTKPVPAFSPLNISIAQLSEQLKGALQNLKKLFNLPFSANGGAIQFTLTGSVTSPRIVFDEEKDSLLNKPQIKNH